MEAEITQRSEDGFSAVINPENSVSCKKCKKLSTCKYVAYYLEANKAFGEMYPDEMCKPLDTFALAKKCMEFLPDYGGK